MLYFLHRRRTSCCLFWTLLVWQDFLGGVCSDPPKWYPVGWFGFPSFDHDCINASVSDRSVHLNIFASLSASNQSAGGVTRTPIASTTDDRRENLGKLPLYSAPVVPPPEEYRTMSAPPGLNIFKLLAAHFCH